MSLIKKQALENLRNNVKKLLRENSDKRRQQIRNLREAERQIKTLKSERHELCLMYGILFKERKDK